jgi:endo-1,4-beta-xylanase
MNMKPMILALMVMTGFMVACAGSPGAGSGKPVAAGDTLKSAHAGYFPIGFAAETKAKGFDSFGVYPESLLSEFNSVVAENCMKPALIQPNEGEFHWEDPDRLVAEAKKRGMLVRGHTLVWHKQTPGWMFLAEGTPAEKKAWSRSRLKTHTDAVVGRYKDDIYCWDVVNEALSDGGGYRVESPWYQAWGDITYVREAFDFARAADPDCKLYYNDYNLENSWKREAAVEMINELDLKAHGLYGIGIQAHWTLTWPTIEEIQTTIDTFHDMGLDVQITELDIDCYNGSDDPKTLPYRTFDRALARRYGEIFACLRQNALEGKISGVTFWGLADDHTWLDHFYGYQWHETPTRKNYPFLFDEKHKKKKAWYTVTDF